MLDVLVRNAHGNLTDSQKDYASKKLGKLDRYFNSASRIELAHIEEKRGHKLEVTVFADGMFLRGEELDSNVHAAIDKVADKLEARLRKLKNRIVKRHRQKGEAVPMGLQDLPAEPEDDSPVSLGKMRHYDLRPISVEDASLQLELLDHPFFVFKNVENSKVEVLYKMNNGSYGLVTPED